MRCIQRIVVQYARAVIVPSEYLRSMVLKWGVKLSRVHVIFNSCKRPNDVMSQSIARDAICIHNPLVISVGRLVPWKGFDTIIKIWPDIRKTIPSAVLAVIGDGPDRKRLTTLIHGLNLTHCIHLIGPLSYGELKKWYCAADMLILNSSYEGLSHIILEAQSYKTPCAVSDVCGNPELVEHGKTGFLFKKDDKKAIKSTIIGLITDKNKAQSIALQAYDALISYDENSIFLSTYTLLKQYARTH